MSHVYGPTTGLGGTNKRAWNDQMGSAGRPISTEMVNNQSLCKWATGHQINGLLTSG